MSRSRKHNPYGGITTARSEKDDKKIWHKKFRRAQKQAIHHGQEQPDYREISDPWGMSKDGKREFYDPKYLRK